VVLAGHASSADTATALAPAQSVHFVGTPSQPAVEKGLKKPNLRNHSGRLSQERDCVVHCVVEGASEETVFTLPLSDRPLQDVLTEIAVGSPTAGRVESIPKARPPCGEGNGRSGLSYDDVFCVATAENLGAALRSGGSELLEQIGERKCDVVDLRREVNLPERPSDP